MSLGLKVSIVQNPCAPLAGCIRVLNPETHFFLLFVPLENCHAPNVPEVLLRCYRRRTKGAHTLICKGFDLLFFTTLFIQIHQ